VTIEGAVAAIISGVIGAVLAHVALDWWRR